MSKSHIAVFPAAALTVVLSLSGCSVNVSALRATSSPTATSSVAGEQSSADQQQALESIVDAARAQLPSIVAASSGAYSDIQIDPLPPATIVYTYTYAKQIDPDAASTYFDGQVSTLQKVADTSVFPAMKSGGLTGDIGAKYVYVNADGSEIWEKTFTPS